MLKKMLTVTLAGMIAVIFSGCGTLFWSERKSQTPSDKIDPAVLILDCVALLFGIIPGVVALVLDFNNNTIYFTKSEAAARSASVDNLDRSELIAVKVDNMDRESIEAAISEQIGRKVTLEELNLVAMN